MAAIYACRPLPSPLRVSGPFRFSTEPVRTEPGSIAGLIAVRTQGWRSKAPRPSLGAGRNSYARDFVRLTIELLLGSPDAAKWEISHGLQGRRVQSWDDRAGLSELTVPKRRRLRIRPNPRQQASWRAAGIRIGRELRSRPTANSSNSVFFGSRNFLRPHLSNIEHMQPMVTF
jgi:hypothetical protein